MNRTTIEWVLNPDGTQGYTLNSKTGCLNGCEYCYARRLANGRLRGKYLANTILPRHDEPNHEAHHSDPFYPRFWPDKIWQVYRRKKPSGIFLDDMSDWMGDCWPEEWTRLELEMIRANPQHIFYTLTKQPQNLIKFNPFPDNCWVGVTATDTRMALEACLYLGDIEASLRYLSIEPMLNSINLPPEHLKVCKIGWLIIGACTGTLEDIKRLIYQYPNLSPMPLDKNMRRWTLQPRLDWVQEIVNAADKAGIPAFLKNNLVPILENRKPFISKRDSQGIIQYPRQEMPDLSKDTQM